MADPRDDIEQLLGRAGLLNGVTAAAMTSLATGQLTWATGRMPGGAPVTADSPLYAASVTKQIVAALAAQAVLAGALDVEASVRAFLPALPAWTNAVRVRHLVHHTSGLPATGRVLMALGLDHDSQLDNDLVLDGLGRLHDPDGAPGRSFVYSNIGYVVLAEIVRRVSGLDLAELGYRRLFGPLAMVRTHLGGVADVILPDRPTPPRTVGDGGLWISAADLLRWLDALNSERLGRDLTRLVQTPGRLDDGTPLTYARGMTAQPGPDGTTYTHGGNCPGWTAKTVRNPTTGTAVALLTCDDDAQTVSDTAVAMHSWLSSDLTG